MLALIRWLIVACAVLACAGCATLEPCERSQLREPDGIVCGLRGVRPPAPRDQRSCLVGSVAGEIDGPIVVVAYRTRPTGVDVVAASVLEQPGPYTLSVPAGTYRLAAFQDDDGDRRYDPHAERAALYHDGGPVVVMPRTKLDRLYLTVRDEPAAAGIDALQRIDADSIGSSPTVVCAAAGR